MAPDDVCLPGGREPVDGDDAPGLVEPSSSEGDPQWVLSELATTAAGVGTFDWNLVTGNLHWDDRLIELFGYDKATFDRTITSFNDRLHPEDLDRVTGLLQHSIDTCGEYEAEYRVVLPGGQTHWVVARGRTLCDEQRAPVRLLGAAWDVTSRREAQERNEQAARRERLLSRITEDLVSTLDLDEAVARLARLVVPALADWCLITLLDDDRQPGSSRGLRHAGSWHTEPRLRPVADAYGRARLGAMADDAMVTRAMRTGKAEVVSANASALAQEMLHPSPARDLLAQLSPESVALLPLTGREGPIGALSLFNGPQREPITPEDITSARHVAARVGLLLENGRLFRQQSRLAERLQRALLTAPPEPDHLQVVVRYVPASQAAEVGGDWYDAFMQPNGATVLVIGDVVGHDTDAAAAMGQIRSIVRTIGAEDNLPPAAVLRRADEVMRTLQVPTPATAVVARLEQTDDDKQQGLTRLHWSNAGHPPPMVLHSDGRVEVLTGRGYDLLLGVDPGARRSESEERLDRDSVVLLYTDGLVERRDQPLDVGLDRLQQTLHECSGHSLDDLCDEVLTRLLPDKSQDDVAIVAVRLHPQDKPRPAEAGPNRVPPNVPPVEPA